LAYWFGLILSDGDDDLIETDGDVVGSDILANIDQNVDDETIIVFA
jgi:hypothetical protein